MKRRGRSKVGGKRNGNGNGSSMKIKSRLAVPRALPTIGDSDDDGVSVRGGCGDDAPCPFSPDDVDDRLNYALLLALYTLQGIPMGLSASIPFLIQQKVQMLAASAGKAAAGAAGDAAASAARTHLLADATRTAYNAQAVFALCSWPFSLKLLWAPVVDACFSRRFGRRKSWLVPIQLIAGAMMMGGSGYVERQLGLDSLTSAAASSGDVSETARMLSEAATPGGGVDGAVATSSFDVRGVTLFFFSLYFLMATQDIAVDGWALTMLSKKNRGKGPVCNSIGQNIGYFLSFVGFLALNDADSAENLWRPLLGLPSRPGTGLVSLGGFVRFMGGFMLVITVLVAVFKKEVDSGVGSAASAKRTTLTGQSQTTQPLLGKQQSESMDDDEDAELDAAEIGLRETYHRLYAACKLPAVRWLVLILLTYRLPCALSDNVKFLKAVEFGLSKQTTALLSPTIVLPLGILVPVIAAKIWQGKPLSQFMFAYKFRVTLVALVDVLMLLAVRSFRSATDVTPKALFWTSLVASTAFQATASTMQFNAQMTFFAHRVDPAIGGSYMTLLNTFANLGGTWPSSFVMYLMGRLTVPSVCTATGEGGEEVCTGGRDAYFPLQLALSALGLIWIFVLGDRVKQVADLPDDAWRTHIGEEEGDAEVEVEETRKGGKSA